MDLIDKPLIKIAILDLYDGVENQGMRCIRDILTQYNYNSDVSIAWDEFDVRRKIEIPDLSYDIFISTGGPGSPAESEGTEWENNYFAWIQQIVDWNNNPLKIQKKQVFFICHSFQLACRYFKFGKVCKRKSTSFGVFPMHLFSSGKNEPVFEGMPDPFYAVDSRDYQVIEPNYHLMHETGASILAIEKERPMVMLERAVMAIRFNEFMIGTQFHPEADAIGMSKYLQTEEKKKTVIEIHGLAKWESMIERLNDPDKIMFTYAKVLPNFLNISIDNLMEVLTEKT